MMNDKDFKSDRPNGIAPIYAKFENRKYSKPAQTRVGNNGGVRLCPICFAKCVLDL